MMATAVSRVSGQGAGYEQSPMHHCFKKLIRRRRSQCSHTTRNKDRMPPTPRARGHRLGLAGAPSPALS